MVVPGEEAVSQLGTRPKDVSIRLWKSEYSQAAPPPLATRESQVSTGEE